MRRVARDELPPATVTRAGTKASEHEVVQKLYGRKQQPGALAAECPQGTGKAMDSYHRRKRELGLRQALRRRGRGPARIRRGGPCAQPSCVP
jgi:hypothetical protein